MKITILVQTLQEYQLVKTYELGQPISVVNSEITFPTMLTIELDGRTTYRLYGSFTPGSSSMTFAQFDELILKKQQL